MEDHAWAPLTMEELKVLIESCAQTKLYRPHPSATPSVAFVMYGHVEIQNMIR